MDRRNMTRLVRELHEESTRLLNEGARLRTEAHRVESNARRLMKTQREVERLFDHLDEIENGPSTTEAIAAD